ncbi:MAG: hypothetical protein K9M17_06125 [Mariprofundaceae bacterium]|nr:hypothetical protein [Mariprofundaceae bacterium]
MPLCYWKLCTCPDTQPCSEHHGNHCGLFNGLQITNNNQVVDGITRNTDAAILRITADEATIDMEIAKAEQRKLELEKMKRDLEAAFDGARNIGQRRAAIQKGMQAYTTANDVNQEALAAAQQVYALTTGWASAFGAMSTKLIRPYSDSTGYCDCYSTKVAQLAAIDSQISASQAQWNTDNAEMAQYRSHLWSIVKAPATIVTGLGIWAYILFGWGAVFIKAMFFILLVIAIMVIAFVLRLLYLKKQMAALAKQLLGLQLIYYRVQSIGTCKKFPGEEQYYENIWWQDEVLKNLPDYETEEQ